VDDDLAYDGAQLLARREVSSVELTELYLRRIEALDPVLNAYRVTFPERALAEAKQADARAKAGDGRPLLGLPIAVKDDCDVAGETTNLGSDAHGPPATQDAEVVRRLRAAGAVILGKAHVPELTITPYTESPTYGVTRNPYDLQRTSGGSSGGSATAVAAGLAAAALGSDGAGSIRIPAGCCGLFGLKAQRGRVPTGPKAELWNGLSMWGPITRRVGDSARFYDAIKDGDRSFAEAAEREPGRLRIAVSTAAPPRSGAKPDQEQLEAVERTVETLRELGHEVDERELEYTLAGELNTLARYLHGIADQGRAMAHPERLSRRTRGYMRLGAAVPRPLIERAKQAADADARALNRIFDDGADLVLTPMFAHRPPDVRRYEGRPAVWALIASIRFVPYCGHFNHTGQPAASVPAGAAADGFPLAVQLVAPPDGEETLISLAAQLEAATGWPDRRPPL
jgi:amidase